MGTSKQDIHDMVIADFKSKWQNELSPQSFQARLDELSIDKPSYPASGSVFSLFAFAWFTIDCVPFVGEYKGWIAGLTVAEGPFNGNVYTDNINLLTTTTNHAYYFMAVGYTSISFYDVNANNLGYFEGTPLGLVGAGGGPGHWN